MDRFNVLEELDRNGYHAVRERGNVKGIGPHELERSIRRLERNGYISIRYRHGTGSCDCGGACAHCACIEACDLTEKGKAILVMSRRSGA